MILIKPSFQIEQVTPEALLIKIEAAGRTCYKSTSAYTNESANAFVRRIIKNGHESVLEHEKISIRVICDRGVSHELVRHRIASYSQESTRYVDSAKGGCCFVIPPWVGMSPRTVTQWEATNCIMGTSVFDSEWSRAMAAAEASYIALRTAGWSPQQARSVLPNSTKTEIVMTLNLRAWRNFFKIRTSPAAHPQMLEITIPMLAELQALLPAVFEDIKVEESL